MPSVLGVPCTNKGGENSAYKLVNASSVIKMAKK
jgi:hypothetical protein